MGRRGNSQMVSRNKVEFLGIKKSTGEKFDLTLQIENAERHFEVSIIDRDGVFGVEFPTELNLLLREFPMTGKKIVKLVQNAYRELISDRRLQTA